MSTLQQENAGQSALQTRSSSRSSGSDGGRVRIDGVVVGRISRLDDDGRPFVSFAGDRGEHPRAKSTVEVAHEDVDREVALCFERGIPGKPIIIGFMWEPDPGDVDANDQRKDLRVESGQERILIEADKEVTLRCGHSSLTLTRAGKIILRGKYVSSYSSGVNRIKGGSVQIN